MSYTVSPDELDHASLNGRAYVSPRANSRVVRCIVGSCRKLVSVGDGRRLWLDGFHRGFICPPCRKALWGT